MKRHFLGALAASALLCAGGAFANDDTFKSDDKTSATKPTSKSTESTSGYGGSGNVTNESTAKNPMPREGTSTDAAANEPTARDASKTMSGSTHQEASNQPVEGEVVKYAGNMLYVKHMGAVVAIKVDKSTEVSDKSMLKEGKSVSAEVKIVNKTQNVATRISAMEAGTGGSGQSGMSDTPAIPERSRTDDADLQPSMPERSPGTPLPEDPGTPRAPSTPDEKSY